MGDVKDIMGVPRGGAPGEKIEKPKEPKLVKPKGMSREAFALLSSTHPLVPSQLMGELKKAEVKDRPKKRGQVTFQWRPFTNPARSDGMELSHWVKCYKDTASGRVTPAEKEYPFLKYNKTTQVLRYNEDEWSVLVHSLPTTGGWTREETDYLLDTIEQLDMRWMAVADRYDYTGGVARTLEDIKGRYYTVARELLLLREGGPDAVANHTLIKHPYSAEFERQRKAGLELLMARSLEADAAEDAILAEAAKIEAKRKAEAGGRRGAGGAGAGGGGLGTGGGVGGIILPAVQVSEIEAEPPVGTPPLFDATGAPALPMPPADAEPGVPAPRVIARVGHTRDIIESILANASPELQKMLPASMGELKLSDLPRAANRSVCGAYLALLREVTEHLELKAKLTARGSGVGMKRVKREDSGDGGGMDGAGTDGDGARSEKRQRVARRPFDE